MTTTYSNNRKTGRALHCLNAEYTDPDFREHIMKTVYVRASMQDSRSIKSRSMQALGYFCFKCRQFQTNLTGVLAPLNGTIAVGIDEISPTDESQITLWKWESGIPLSPLASSTNGTIGTTANSTSTAAE